MKRLFLLTIIVGFFLQSNAQVEPLLLYKATQDAECRAWVDSVYSNLSLRERVAQLFIYTIAPTSDKANLNLLKEVVQNQKVGGLLFSKGEMDAQAILTNQAQEMANTPLMITFDGEWGLSMRLKNVPTYSRNMVLGCITDEQLLYDYGKEIARQCKELGIHVNFAPVADVNINPKNPVINTRSFGESPYDVADKVIMFASGMESGGVLSVSKHFPGHGDTETDSHHALPLLNFSKARLDSIELYPFKQAIRAGVGGIMVGHLEIPALEPQKGLPSSLSANVVQKLLIDEMGFKGLVFTDALEMKGVAGVSHTCLAALKAGNDMLLAPRRIKVEIDAVMQAIKQGELSEEEINRKCRKVLMYKYVLGAARQQPIRLSGLSQRINTPYAKGLGERLDEAAITVINNPRHVLPLDQGVQRVALLNVGAVGGHAVLEKTMKEYVNVKRFQLKQNALAPERKVLRDSLANYKRVVVCISERQLATYRDFFNELPADLPVVYLFFTPEKPLVQLEAALAKASAVILAHKNAEHIQTHVGKILFGDAIATGRMSTSVGRVFKVGDGVTLLPPVTEVVMPEDYGLSSEILKKIDEIAKEGITEGAYPGCQIAVMKNGQTVYSKAFGTFSGKGSSEVTTQSVYDIASLTKTSATLLAVMKLYDRGMFSLSDKASKYVPFIRNTDKANLTIRELLLHESGLASSIPFYLMAIDTDSYQGRLFKGARDAQHTVQLDAQTFAQPSFKFLSGLTSATPDNVHSTQITENIWISTAFNDSIDQNIISSKLRTKRYLYSCIGFIILQRMVEEISGMPLDMFLIKEFYDPMGLTHTAYQPLRYMSKENIVPSSNDKFLRKTILQGTVHDEAAAFLGGVSGNAGLFSTAEEIAQIHQMVLNGGELNGKRYLSKETCKLFTTEKSRTSRRGLGYDRPDKANNRLSPCSESAPASTYGHTGFTGTCAWVDPRNQLVFVFLSNRTYPNVWVNKLAKLKIRDRIQEVIYEALSATNATVSL